MVSKWRVDQGRKQGRDGNGDAASIDRGHGFLVVLLPCQEQREKHPAGWSTMS